MTPNEVGTRIKARREQMGWRIDQLCSSLDQSASHVEAIENGTVTPTEQERNTIANFLSVPIEYLVGSIELAEVIAVDERDTERMAAWISERFRALSNQSIRRVVFEQIKEIIEE